MEPTTARHPFLPLPGVADTQADLLTDDPAWRYRSACAAGGGLAHLRVWRAEGDPVRGHVAIVTETGLGASTTNSAGEIWSQLASEYLGPLVLLEHWAAGDGEDHDRLDQVAWTAGARTGGASGPTLPTNPDHDRLDAWMQSYGHDLLAAHRTPV